MKLTFYGYNTFVIRWGDKVIAIDPGASFYLPDFFKPLIPRADWSQITHIFVTHGDPDHHWYTDRVAQISGAKVICNENMVHYQGDQYLMLGPRSKGLTFNTIMDQVTTLSVDATIGVDGMLITGVMATHGPLNLKIGPFRKTLHQGPNERFGYGAIGFKIKYRNQTLINLGDTILYEHDWSKFQAPDILMVPIGGKIAGNTMDEKEAIKAVEVIRPKLVIPVHYNCGALFNKCYNPADDQLFKKQVEQIGSRCCILPPGASLNYQVQPDTMLSP